MTDLAAWPALVLAAGLGTRLRPLSQVRAKAALPIGDEVLIQRILRWLRQAGVRRVVVNLHHRPETITPHVGDGADLGLEVRYSWEPIVLGSGGGPARALPLLDAPRFLIVNGDTLTDVALPELAAHHTATGAHVTMAVTTGDPRYGGVRTDAEGRVLGFTRQSRAAPAEPAEPAEPVAPAEPAAPAAPAAPAFHFVGVQAVERDVFAAVSGDRPSESVWGRYPEVIAAAPGAIRVVHTAAPFHDIGTPADYQRTVRALTGGAGNQVGRDTAIHPTARVSGSILWDRVDIGANATLVDCIVADEVHVPPGARYERAVIVSDGGELTATAI